MARQRTYEKFVSNLIASHKVVETLAECFIKYRSNIVVPPLSITPDKAHRWEFIDEGDMIYTKKNDKQARLEVKQYKKEDFKSNMDFDKEYILIDEVYKIEKTHKIPLGGYCIVNASVTGFVWIPKSSFKYWFKVFLREYDDTKGHWSYAIDKRRVKYYGID